MSYPSTGEDCCHTTECVFLLAYLLKRRQMNGHCSQPEINGGDAELLMQISKRSISYE